MDPDTQCNGANTNGAAPRKPVLFFDIDNCLYPKSAKVHDLMAVLIDDYFEKHLSLSRADAIRLHAEYYTNYGLAIEGLVRHHEIDPLEYNSRVDDALPLQDVLSPDPELLGLLRDLDRRRVRPWLFTNAYANHARRVVSLLGVEGQFDGLTYCDYATAPILCKPHPDMFAKAMREAGVDKMDDCYFVDDSFSNCSKAHELGWTAAHLVEEGVELPPKQAAEFQIRHIQELRRVFPQFFLSSGKDASDDDPESLRAGREG